jgi:hypothetical protein
MTPESESELGPEQFTFKQMNCTVCNESISMGGAAYTSHMRMHVRRKEATEHKHGKKLLFIPANAHVQFIENQPYAKLGEEPLPGQPKGVWDMTDVLAELKAVDPASYFITSGEAVRKAEKLVKDAYSLAVKCRSFLNKLRQSRGIRKYLETGRENGRLIVKGKDPRARPEDEEQATHDSNRS